MTIRTERVVFDTNIWIFGLRRQSDRPACYTLLERIGELHLLLPRQILRELQANLTESELRFLFRLIHHFPDRIEFRWSKAHPETVKKYQRLGCRLGDAVIAAHLEEEGIRTLISENRDFLQEVPDLPFRVISAAEALQHLNAS